MHTLVRTLTLQTSKPVHLELRIRETVLDAARLFLRAHVRRVRCVGLAPLLLDVGVECGTATPIDEKPQSGTRQTLKAVCI